MQAARRRAQERAVRRAAKQDLRAHHTDNNLNDHGSTGPRRGTAMSIRIVCGGLARSPREAYSEAMQRIWAAIEKTKHEEGARKREEE